VETSQVSFGHHLLEEPMGEGHMGSVSEEFFAPHGQRIPVLVQLFNRTLPEKEIIDYSGGLG
jgi:hypothetical protein